VDLLRDGVEARVPAHHLPGRWDAQLVQERHQAVEISATPPPVEVEFTIAIRWPRSLRAQRLQGLHRGVARDRPIALDQRRPAGNATRVTSRLDPASGVAPAPRQRPRRLLPLGVCARDRFRDPAPHRRSPAALQQLRRMVSSGSRSQRVRRTIPRAAWRRVRAASPRAAALCAEPRLLDHVAEPRAGVGRGQGRSSDSGSCASRPVGTATDSNVSIGTRRPRARPARDAAARPRSPASRARCAQRRGRAGRLCTA